MAMSVNTLNVIEYLKAHNGENLTAQDVADALDVDVKVVNGAFTSGIQNKGLGQRIEAEIELDDGSHKKVKFLTLTADGLAFTAEDSEA